ncbi:MAG: hypothetical protein IJJ59_13475 [Pseudobutyrivibrio sp.]|uniref:DUF6625 family protein n=1 Tax=Pseudobutyrivibrio sp. TaxID=2014367 RepID=UPI0025EF4FC3|nr:DUF6625 family protein [Pseudobutyrivibrio sp.]MBQ6464331.1 hypothetical protein [Pseudobutyrivibrio sp.]
MKCCFIVPYFGKLPKEFPIFLKTCGFNKGFDWIIYTDDHTYFDYPQNVIVKYMEFSDFRELAESKFDFSISMDSPYKLCDYKPAYGLICEEDIVEYDFWGHTDIDVVLGDLSSFIFENMLKKYDKLFCLGHCVLYRNSYENNRVFMSEYKGDYLYKKVYSTPDICWFDEEWKDDNNINRIFLSLNKPVFFEDYSANISIKTQRFNRVKFVMDIDDYSKTHYDIENIGKCLYTWEDGHLYRFSLVGGKLKKEEFMYLHYQQRHMRYNSEIVEASSFKIVPNSFLPYKKNIKTISDFYFTVKTGLTFYGVRRKLKFFSYKYDGLKKRMRRT